MSELENLKKKIVILKEKLAQAKGVNRYYDIQQALDKLHFAAISVISDISKNKDVGLTNIDIRRGMKLVTQYAYDNNDGDGTVVEYTQICVINKSIPPEKWDIVLKEFRSGILKKYGHVNIIYKMFPDDPF